MIRYAVIVAAAGLALAACTPEQVGLVVDTAAEAAVLTGHPAAASLLYCVEAFCPTGPH